MKLKKTKTIFIAICLLIANSVFCFSQQKTDNITIIEDCTNHQFNPQLTDLSSDVQILCAAYEGLFSYNPVTLDPVYAIAVNYRISRDKKRWTFDINPNARFSNGEHITANHVRNTWLKLLSSKDAPYASLLDVIEGAAEYRTGEGFAEDVGIYAISDSQLMVHLCKPASYLPKILCHPAFSVMSDDENVYSGAYVISEVYEKTESENAKIILKKNPYYWDAEAVLTEQITFIQSDDEEENAFMYNTGFADWVYASISTQKLIEKTDFLINAEYGTSFMFFKLKQNEDEKDSIWNQLEFRQALFEAFPWEKFRANYYVPATTYVFPLQGYPEVEGFDFTDLIEAKKIMEEARKTHGIPQEVKIPLNMEISKGSFNIDQLLLLKRACDSLNIELQVKEIPVHQYLSGVPSSDADLFYYTWIGDFADPYAFLELFRSDSTLNAANYSNAEFDELLEKAAMASAEESLKIYAQAENLLLDSCIVLPVSHPITANIINTDLIGGWSLNALDLHPLKYLYRKNVKVVLGNNVI